MSQKKIFLVLVVTCTVSLSFLLHNRSYFSRTMEALHLGYPTLHSHFPPGLKPNSLPEDPQNGQHHHAEHAVWFC